MIFLCRPALSIVWLFILVSVVIGFSSAFGQQTVLQVVDASGAPRSSATVQVFTSGSATATDYLLTDDNGSACCLSTVDLDSVIVSHVSAGTVIFWPSQLSLAQEGVLVAVLADRAERLPEAVITESFSGIVVSGDTIRFLASKFADGRERDVADLLNAMPGLEASRDGTLRYNGKRVDRVLIDGQDIVRSQFQLVNDLVMGRDVRAAEMITETDAKTLQERQTLNILSKSGAGLRINAEAGTSARGEPLAEATALSMRPDRWQGYFTARTRNHGEPALASSDALRDGDTDLIGLRSERSVLSNANTGEIRQLGIVDATVRQRRDHVGQLSLNRQRASSSSRALFSHRYTVERSRTTETLLAIANADTVVRFGLNSTLPSRTSTLTVGHVDTSVHRLSIEAFSGATLTSYDLRRAGSLGGFRQNAQSLRQDQSASQLRAYGTAYLEFEIDERWSASMFGELMADRSRADDRLQDSYPIYGAALMQVENETFVLATAQSKRLLQGTIDARLTRRVGKQYIELVVQRLERNWTESFATDPSGALTEQRADPQTETTDHLLIAGRIRTDKWRFNPRGGLASILYADAGVRHRTTGPHAAAELIYIANDHLNLRLNAGTELRGYDADVYWTTPTPTDTRQIRLGTDVQQPAGRVSRVNLVIRDYNRGRGTIVIFVAGASTRERNLSLVARDMGDYVALTPTPSFGERALSSSLFGNGKIGDLAIGGSLSYTSSNSELQRPGGQALRLDRGLGSITLTYRRFKSVHLRFNAGGNHVTQYLDFGGDEPLKLSLTSYRTEAGIVLRGVRWTGEIGGGARLGARLPALPTLRAQVNYRKPGSPFGFELRGEDLLRYEGATYRTARTGTDGYRYTEYAQLPGFVVLSGSYTFGK